MAPQCPILNIPVSFKLYCYWLGQSGTSNTQYFIGFSSSSTLPTSDTPFESGVSGVFVMLRQADNNATPGTLKILHNDARGSTVMTDTGKGYGGSTTYHKVEIHLSSTNVKVFVEDFHVATLTSDIPATTTPLYPYALVRRVAVSNKSINIYKFGVISK